ncbi:hypothetical protein D3C73_683800 [compost metagenome]
MKKNVLVRKHHIRMFDDVFTQVINMDSCFIVEIETATIDNRNGVFSIHTTKLAQIFFL